MLYRKENKSQNGKFLFGLGACANTLNIALPLIEFLPSDNSFLGKSQKLYHELATGFTAAFFSTRRHFMGKEWLEKNTKSVERVTEEINKMREPVFV
ncbi:MAG: hypothetical protein A3B68_00560 [Candidatus Melainabacteria bacterium RIFCSPHIGHO2_02_FULL_34_12]|nr:MAG: hypothetical protein A3B68_00560 [Candidatus Melainabacteria bacterium RIFCSPHIGHO2_02_FULL_34_12]